MAGGGLCDDAIAHGVQLGLSSEAATDVVRTWVQHYQALGGHRVDWPLIDIALFYAASQRPWLPPPPPPPEEGTREV